MTPDRWRQVKDVLWAAWERDAGERPAFLNQVLADDVELRAHVEALLVSDESDVEFLATPAMELAIAQAAGPSLPAADNPEDRLIQAAVARAIEHLPEDTHEGSELIGTRVGRYWIAGLIGKGGMGAVYRAEREGDFRMQVAIKLLKRGTDTEAALNRFRIERQILAGLQHPNIARLLDGGATETGLPYFVMEYVQGAPLLEYAAPLSVRQRLELFRSVCSAVRYAHRNRIVHRDIKPANILVTPDGIPKLLDFGIAKLLDPAADGATTALTAAGARLMTPDYASPEQVRGGPVTTATDVYSLGAVLYELLTGQRAHHAETYSPEAIEKEICNNEPKKPSAVASHLDPDLDNIILMALRKEPQRRYASVEQFSDDLDRFLQDRPVHARKESLLYRGRKFLKRNRLTASLSAALILALCLVTGLHLGEWISGRQDSAAPRSLAVVQIENLAQDASLDWMGRGVCELLTTNLANVKAIQVVSTERVLELIGRRVKGNGNLPASQARDVAREAHADMFLSGALTRRGARVRLDLRVQETATGRVRFAGKVEGADAQAVFSIADQMAARILAKLAPREAGPKPDSAAALTANPEALQAYEEGLSKRTVFLPETEKALRRAIDLDPQFLMAHYYLADWLRYSGNVPEARRTIARAVQLAERAPVPRLQKLLVQALQLRLDLQLDEAAKVLETAHREFAREIEPLYQLANMRSAEGRFAEAATLLEEAARRDERHALAHDQLGYQYGFLGDVARGIASIDRYAALLPPGDVVPFCSRDVYMINERYGDAIAEFRKIRYWIPMATAAVHAGDYVLSESTLEAVADRKPAWYSSWGDLAAARGQLDRAAPYYEEEARRLQSPLREWFALLKAARLFLEQRRPEDVLALGRRHKTPWAAGVRGTADLLLHKEADAEKEFAALRDSVAPILGDYVAGKIVEFHRMQAASYAGRFDQVIQMWPRLPRSFWSLYALDVGRAYLQSGVFTEAEYHLRLAWTAQRAFFMNADMQAQHNSLTWMLAQFYLGQVLEKTGRENEAITNYQAFLKHFEHSSARLPQIAAARALVARFRLSERGHLLFSDEFSRDAFEPGWVGDPRTWQIAGGVARASGRPEDDQPVRRGHALAYHDAIFEFSFRLDGARLISLSLNNKSGEVCRFLAWPNKITLLLLKPNPPSGLKPEQLAGLRTDIEPGKWHKVVVDVHGKRIIAQIDGKHTQTIAGESPRVDVDKTGFRLSVDGGSASFDYVRVYEASSK